MISQLVLLSCIPKFWQPFCKIKFHRSNFNCRKPFSVLFSIIPKFILQNVITKSLSFMQILFFSILTSRDYYGQGLAETLSTVIGHVSNLHSNQWTWSGFIRSIQSRYMNSMCLYGINSDWGSKDIDRKVGVYVENHGIHSSELLFHNHGSRLITWSSILWFLMMLFILCILSFILLIFDKSLLCYWIADWYLLQFSHSHLYCLLIHYISPYDILRYSMD